MEKRRMVIVLLASALAVAGLSSPAFGQQTIEGTVISTTLTACELKPGTCEGNLVLETRTAGKAGQVTIKVPKGTLIKQGNDYLFLPGTKGRRVAITYIEDKGEKVARARLRLRGLLGHLYSHLGSGSGPLPLRDEQRHETCHSSACYCKWIGNRLGHSARGQDCRPEAGPG